MAKDEEQMMHMSKNDNANSNSNGVGTDMLVNVNTSPVPHDMQQQQQQQQDMEGSSIPNQAMSKNMGNSNTTMPKVMPYKKKFTSTPLGITRMNNTGMGMKMEGKSVNINGDMDKGIDMDKNMKNKNSGRGMEGMNIMNTFIEHHDHAYSMAHMGAARPRLNSRSDATMNSKEMKNDNTGKFL